MVQRLTIAVILLLAVLSASAPQPVRACAMAMPTLQKAPCTDCCARMKFCVLRQENQVPPASATASSQQSIQLAAQPIESLFGKATVTLPERHCFRAELFSDSPPRLAVLCTFLI